MVAAKVIKLFGFPCRLISIDLGIDAEIEIINDNAKSTGEFLKCQIKTTQTKNNFVYVQERHLIYWNSINIPVIVFLVHLNTEKIFWHCIKDISQYEKSGESVKILFDEKTTLSKRNKRQFIDLIYFKSAEEIRRIYESSCDLACTDKTELLDTDNYDFTTVEFFVSNLMKIEDGFAKVRKLQRRHVSLEKIDTEYKDQLDLIRYIYTKLESFEISLKEMKVLIIIII